LSGVGNDHSLLLLLLSGTLLNLSLIGLFVDNDDQFIGIFLFDLDIFHSKDEFLLEDIDFIGGSFHSGKTTIKTSNIIDNSALLLAQELLVEADKLKERRGGGIVKSSFANLEFLISIVDGQMNIGHVLSNRITDLAGWELNFSEEPVSDANEGISRPGVEPIDRCAIDQGRELTSTESERISDRRET